LMNKKKPKICGLDGELKTTGFYIVYIYVD
jgi:hypothetical protein